MEAFVYCWTDMLTNKLYVGVHKGSEDDGYVCSSKYMKEEYNKRPQDFSRQIIANGVWEDMRVFEEKILTAFDAARDPMFYNHHNGGNKFYGRKGRILSEEHKRKIGESRKGKPGRAMPEETRNKISKTRKGCSTWNKGRSLSEETRQKMSESRKGGRLSEETKQKMRASRLKYLEQRRGN